jgi:hypothetical protein
MAANEKPAAAGDGARAQDGSAGWLICRQDSERPGAEQGGGHVDVDRQW